jgi:hypothetical protein
MRALAFSAFVVIAAAALAACRADYPQDSTRDPHYAAPATPDAHYAPPAVQDPQYAPARPSGPPRPLLVPPPQ